MESSSPNRSTADGAPTKDAVNETVTELESLQTTVDLPEGTKLGRYIIGSRVGAGAMGTVYEAVDPDLNRKLAIKVLKLTSSSSAHRRTAIHRIRREAQALAQLNDPYVVTIHDIGQVEGSVFVAMDFIEGRTLRVWLDEKTRTPKEILRVFVLAGKGLAAAHRAGLVHRDFKPDNVMVTPRGRVYVLDFGLARSEISYSNAAAPSSGIRPTVDLLGDSASSGNREMYSTDSESLSSTATQAQRASSPHEDAFQPPSSHETQLIEGDNQETSESVETQARSSEVLHEQFTLDGAIVGTPAYMSPEQHLGERTDARTDQFSFSVALYEALFGELPFAGKNVRARAVNVISGELGEVPRRRGVSSSLRRTIITGLGRSPERRHPSMGDMLMELSPSTSNWPQFALIGGGAAIISAALILAVPGTDDAVMCTRSDDEFESIWNPSISEAWAKKIDATDPTALPTADYLRRTLATYSSEWNDIAQESCEHTYVEKTQSEELYDLTMQCLADRKTALRTLVAQLAGTDDLLSINPVTAVHGLPEIIACRDANALRESSENELSPAQLDTYRQSLQAVARANVLVDVGKAQEALADLSPFLVNLQHDHPPRLRAPIALSYGLVLERLGRYQEANQALEQASIDAELAGDRTLTAKARVALTVVTGDRLANESVGMLWSRLATSAIEAAGIQGSSLEAQLHSNIGLVLEKAERHSEAFERFRHALFVATRADSPEPVRSSLHNNFANSLATHGEFEEAIEQAKRAYELAANSLGENSVAALAAVGTEALVWDLRGDYERSLKILERAIKVLEDKHRAYAPLAVSLRGNRAVLLAKLGRLHEAEGEFHFVLKARTETFGTSHPDVAAALTNLAACLRMDGRVSDSVPHQERAVAILNQSPTKNPGRLALALSGLANSLERLGKVNEALPLRLRVLEIHDNSRRGPDSNFIVDLANAVHTMALVSDPRAIEYSDRAMEFIRDHDINDATRAYTEITRARALLSSAEGKLPSTRQDARKLVNEACGRLPKKGSEAERRVAAEIFAAQRWTLPAACKVADPEASAG